MGWHLECVARAIGRAGRTAETQGMAERSIRDVPRPVIGLLLVALAAQIGWHGLRPGPQAGAQALPEPPSIEALRVAALGDPWVTAKVLMLWLQAFDNQPGISIPFRDLDYARVEGWLARILELDPRAQYPLLAASRVYGAVSVEEKQRRMLDFVYRQFRLDPDRRWRWMAYAAIAAKHRLRDLPLALEYARAITEHATGPEVPNWARHMSVVVLEDMGELEAATILIYQLLDSGVVTDPHEVRFLTLKLEELKAGMEAAR